MGTFVVNRMHAGGYLKDNLGGEVINLLHDDKNRNYILINPYGFIDKRYDDTVEGIILTRLTKSDALKC